MTKAVMSRRRLLGSTLAAPFVSGAATILAPYRRALALPTAYEATAFDGNTFMYNLGTIQGFPAADPCLNIKIWFASSKQPSGGGSLNYNLITLHDPTTGSQFINITASNTGQKNKWYLQVFAGRDSTHQLYGVTAPGTIPFNGNGQILDIQFNATTGILRAILNNTTLTWTTFLHPGTPFNIPFLTNPVNSAPLKWIVGNSWLPPHYPGLLGEIYVIAGGGGLDITDPNVRAAFIDPVTGKLRRAGDFPSVTDSSGDWIADVNPQIHLSGGPGDFYTNRPQWTVPAWDWANPQASAIDNGPNKFQISGTLGYAAKDPWN